MGTKIHILATRNKIFCNFVPLNIKLEVFMADNYLEKHYEEYEKRKAEWEKAKRLGKYVHRVKKESDK
ncbi:MAG: hypothetical protein MJ007_06990 [Paludibacteraceae bacterium]|nr:hypothetical protein [Paludibacteraceae bacterium]